MNKKVSKLNVKKKAPKAPSREQLLVRISQLGQDRKVIGERLVDLVEKANRLAEAHTECKEQMRATELDLVTVGKEIRAVNKTVVGMK